MKASKQFDRSNVYTGSSVEQLPTDRAYVIQISGAKEVENSYSHKPELEIMFDISEGDYKGYYNNRYEADRKNNEDAKWKGTMRIAVPYDDEECPEWLVKKFNTSIVAIEDSNPGYTWDWNEAALFGKTVGLVLQNAEYEVNGHKGFWSKPYSLIAVEDARQGKFKQPKDKLLNNDNSAASTPAPANVDDEIPFK